jgi:hypothetical protein
VLQLGGTEPGKSLVTSDCGKGKRVETLDGHAISRKVCKASTELGARSL